MCGTCCVLLVIPCCCELFRCCPMFVDGCSSRVLCLLLFVLLYVRICLVCCGFVGVAFVVVGCYLLLFVVVVCCCCLLFVVCCMLFVVMWCVLLFVVRSRFVFVVVACGCLLFVVLC